MSEELMIPGTESGGRPEDAPACESCPAWWLPGARHCPHCHETYIDGAIESHRKGGECYPPESVGLIPANLSFHAWKRGTDL